MNRKNAIQTVFYIFCVVIMVGIFAYIEQQKTDLEETLIEKENELSAMTQTLQEAVTTIDEQKEKQEKLSAQLETTTQTVDKLNTDVSEMTTANEKLQTNYTSLQNDYKKLQGEYNTLKKNKAVAASNTNNKAVVVSRSSNQAAAKEFYVSATAYTAYCSGCTGITATGLNLRANPSMKVIAVDPRVIPLGSKVWVEGYGYAIAGDTGGAIKGNKVDLFMASKNDAYLWGRKKVRIKVF